MEVKPLIHAIGWVSGLMALGKLFAFLRDVLMAAYFGTSAGTDVYLVTRWIPITAPLLVVCVIFFAQWMGIASLMLGLLLGEILRVGVQLPPLLLKGWRFRFGLHDPVPNTVSFWKVAGYSGGIVLMTQTYVLVDRALASGLAPGSIAALGFALRGFTVMHELFALSVATVLFPTFAQQAALPQPAELGWLLKRSLRVITIVALPLSALLFAFARPLTALLFERGQFHPGSAELTASALRPLSLQVFGAAFLAVLLKACYAQGEARIPFLIALLSLGVGIVLKGLLVPGYGIQGLAFASAMAINLNALLLFIVMHRNATKVFSGKPGSNECRVHTETGETPGSVGTELWPKGGSR